MKKIFCLVLAILTICICFAGCGANGTSSDNTTNSTTNSTNESTTETENKDENKTNSDVDVITSVAMGDITFDFKTKTSDFLNQIDKTFEMSFDYATGEEFVHEDITKDNLNELYNKTIDTDTCYITLIFDAGEGMQAYVVVDVKVAEGKSVGEGNIFGLHFSEKGIATTKSGKTLEFKKSTPADLKEIFGKEDEFYDDATKTYVFSKDAEFGKLNFHFENDVLSGIVVYNY